MKGFALAPGDTFRRMIRRAKRTSLLAAVLPTATALLPQIELCVHLRLKIVSTLSHLVPSQMG